MNILYLANHFNVGGITSYILTLAKGMKKKGYNAYVAAGKGELSNLLAQEGIAYIPIPAKTKAEISLNVLASFLKLLPEIKKKNIDIIHANTRVTQVIGCLLSHYTHKPFISTCHGFFNKRFFRRIFPCWGAKVIAISEQVKIHLMNDFLIPEAEIRLIHHGIDKEKFIIPANEYIEEKKNELGLSNGPVIGIIARLSPVKGHVYLIQALKIVLEKFPSAQLLIVGEGKIKQGLVNLCKKLEITKQVNFVPNTLDTKAILSVMDIFVLPSLHEGLGLSLMEAMIMGRAVIGTEVGGIKALIHGGVNGLLVKPENVLQLSDAIIELLLDSGKRKILGNNAKIFIEENFSEEKMIHQTEKLYLECLPR